MTEDDETDDIRPGHFAAREADRGAKGALIRLFDELDDGRQQELLRFAEQLRQKKPTGLREVGPESEVRGGHEAPDQLP